jgi:predicted RNA-binding Zn ribbon-like protein
MLCLDFSNTLHQRNGASREDLRSYSDLVRWGKEKGLITNSQADAILENPGRGADTLRKAKLLRESIYSVLSAVAHDRPPMREDIATLNQFVSAGMSKSKVVPAEGGFRWEWEESADPDVLLWPISKSAADLLTSDALGLVRECANEEEGCAWLFMDSTKNHSKRWCSMSSCGNRAKAKRFYNAHEKAKEAGHESLG